MTFGGISNFTNFHKRETPFGAQGGASLASPKASTVAVQ